jgi:spore coat polysaccharide biosynthesis protein SpsF
MITAIIQTRMSSTRLPGKVLMEFSGNSVLGHIVERVSHAKSVSKIVIATTTNPADDLIVQWANDRNIPCFRGNETDVLNRYYEAAVFANAEHIARITSDDPFKDPQVTDDVAALYFNEGLDFAYNNHPPTFAEGLDTEIFSIKALTWANQEAKDPFEREHVTQFFYRNPSLFRQKNLTSPINYSHLRWTLDTPEDLAMTKTVYRHLFKPGAIFLAADILHLLEQKPEISLLNQNVSRSAMYKSK